MPPNETTVLLTNYREKHIISSCRQGYGASGHNPKETKNTHVVEVSKDPDEYDAIFSIEDYSSALTLAELLPYQDDPWWQKLRWILFSSYWIILLMTLVTACLMSYMKAGNLYCKSIDQELFTQTVMPPMSIVEIVTPQVLAAAGKVIVP